MARSSAFDFVGSKKPDAVLHTGSSWSIRRPLVQLLIGLACGIILPIVFHPLRYDMEWAEFFDSSVKNTTIGVTAAICLGYYFLRKLTVIPGPLGALYVFPAFGMAYGIIITLFLFMRFDYGRLQFGASFAISLIWFLTALDRSRGSTQTVALVPVGDTLSLSNLPDVKWNLLKTPTLPPNCSAVVADVRANHSAQWQGFITDCVLSGVPVLHVKQAQEALTGRVEIEHLSENTLGSLNPNDTYLQVKKIGDFIAAVLVLLLAWPFFLLIALLVKIDSPGAAIFAQPRVGYRGKVFTIYKFRTMSAQPSHAEGDARQSAMTSDNDQRITRLGRFLRKMRIDELPQVFNILRGQMSWIGPRPEAQALSKWYEGELAFYRYRHIVRPGITGWAQINQGHVTEVDDVLEKLHYDFFYVKNFSFWLDLLITFRTIRTILTGFGSR